jgi:RHS repeat-associated protein
MLMRKSLAALGLLLLLAGVAHAQVFALTGSMSTARDTSTATPLNNGMVLIVGGYDNGVVITTAELYNPTTGVFTLTGSPNIARAGQTATLLNNGMVLIAGGATSLTAELYDPATGTFTMTAGPMHGGETSATLLQNGMVLMVGGTSAGPNAELYNPATGLFTTTGSLNTSRCLQSATLLNNGKVLIAGGYNDGTFCDSGTTNPLASAELYNPSTGTFAPTGSMSTGRIYHSATLLQNGNVLIAGGDGTSNVLASAQIYNPSTGAFTNTGSLHTARSSHTATLLNNGQVLVAGGVSNTGGVYLASAELYSPSGGTFATTGNMTVTRAVQTATLLANGMVLVAGGDSSTAPPFILASAELYNPAGAFTATGSLNAARDNHSATLLPNGAVLIAGGYNGTSVLGSAELYNPATGTFAITGTMVAARTEHTGTLLQNGLVLIAGGSNGSTVLSSAELYNPSTGTFSATTGSLHTARELATATLLPNGTVLIAGGTNGSTSLSSAELYNPSTGTFTPTTGSLNTARAGATATLLGADGTTVLITGGFNGSSYFKTAELYNTVGETFTLVQVNMNKERAYHTATELTAGTVLLIGGCNICGSGGGYLNTAEVYTGGFAFTNGNMNKERASQTATLLGDGIVLVAGGYNCVPSSCYLNTAEWYNPSTGDFAYTTGNMLNARAYHTATLLQDGTVLLTGGYNGTSYLSAAELYGFTPSTPVISALSPSSGAIGASVTITGANFSPIQGTVKFGSIVATVTSWTAGSIRVTVPAGATTSSVVVWTSGLASNGVSFTVVPAPSITSLNTLSGPVGTPVVISGANFGSTQGTGSVTFNGVAVSPSNITNWSASSITANVPPGATTGNVIVQAGGVGSNPKPFTVTPFIVILNPTSGAVGSSVSILGTNFGAAQLTSTVTFNGLSAGTTTTWNDGNITVNVPSGATSGSIVVTVAGFGSNSAPFTVLPTPNITNLSVTTGAAGNPVTMTGTNFGSPQGSSTVTFNGLSAGTASSWSAGSITVNVPAGATTGNVVVTVSGVPSNGLRFTVTSPAITSLNPTAAELGVSVTINGVNFGSSQGSSTVTFNGVSGGTAPTWTATAITLNVPNGATTGNAVVTVSGIASNGFPFTVLPTPGPTNAYYYIQDSLGTTRVIATISGSTATLCYDADYYPYGGERAYTNSCAQNYKFTGQERDPESNLDNFIARYFSSMAGRFVSPDPMGMSVADASNPQSWNQYTYVTNNPESLVDPTGLDGEDDGGGDDGGGSGGCFLGCGGGGPSGPIWIEAGPLPGVPNFPRTLSGGIDWQTLILGPACGGGLAGNPCILSGFPAYDLCLDRGGKPIPCTDPAATTDCSNLETQAQNSTCGLVYPPPPPPPPPPAVIMRAGPPKSDYCGHQADIAAAEELVPGLANVLDKDYTPTPKQLGKEALDVASEAAATSSVLRRIRAATGFPMSVTSKVLDYLGYFGAAVTAYQTMRAAQNEYSACMNR